MQDDLALPIDSNDKEYCFSPINNVRFTCGYPYLVDISASCLVLYYHYPKLTSQGLSLRSTYS